MSNTQQIFSLDPTLNLVLSLVGRLRPVEKTVVKKYLEKEKSWKLRFGESLLYFRHKTKNSDEQTVLNEVLESIAEVRREQKSSS